MKKIYITIIMSDKKDAFNMKALKDNHSIGCNVSIKNKKEIKEAISYFEFLCNDFPTTL